MKSQQIHFDDGEVRATLTIVKATYQADLERQALVDEALEAARQAEPPTALSDIYRRNAEAFVYPSLLCATHTATIERLLADKWLALEWPVSFGDLMGLPADLIDEWAGAVYDLNPRWDLARKAAPAEVEKKAPNSTGG